MKKVFIIKSKNEITNEVKRLSTFAFKNYNLALETLKESVICDRFELQQKEYDNNTDMTEIIKGFIEVYETKKGQLCETETLTPVKTYNYNF